MYTDIFVFTINEHMRTATLTILLLIVAITGFLLITPVVFAADIHGYEQDEMIVKYKTSQSPDELSIAVSQRQQEGNKFIIGPVAILLQDLSLKLSGTTSPEEHLETIKKTDASIGVIGKKVIFGNDHNEGTIYIVKLDGTRSVDAAVELYRKLSEVEYAEPNYLNTTTGI